MYAKEFVRDQELQLDVTRRFDCPECGKRNTFSVTKKLDGVKYMCFSSSCGVKGVLTTSLSVDDIKKALDYTDLGSGKCDQKIFEIPEYWISANRHSSTMTYLTSYNLHELYFNGCIDVRYDPKQDRHVFISYDVESNMCIGAFGRASSKHNLPKWYNYSEIEKPYIVPYNGGDISLGGIIIEDPTSAAVASKYGDGISLLGTYLKPQYIPTLSSYDKLLICLDKDASKKSLDIQRKLCYYSDTDIILLERDIKYLNDTEIKKLFNI